MPTLNDLRKYKTVLCPVSKVTCQIGLTYGDKLELQRSLLADSNLSVGDIRAKDEDGEVKDMVSQITLDTMNNQRVMLLEKGIKSWDLMDDGKVVAITWENIGLLCEEDGQFLHDELNNLSQPEQEAPEEKKKGKSV